MAGIIAFSIYQSQNSAICLLTYSEAFSHALFQPFLASVPFLARLFCLHFVIESLMFFKFHYNVCYDRSPRHCQMRCLQK